MTVQVRRLAAADKPRWLTLFKGYIQFYKATVAEEVIEQTWQRLMAGTADFHIGLVAEVDGEVVGLAHVLFHRSTWSPTFYCYLEDLFVDPSVRKKGIGRALIEATYREADARGCTRTYWATQEFNYRARTLYDAVATKSPFIQYRR
jgi:GNAT superfamily N-acetyltransferase